MLKSLFKTAAPVQTEPGETVSAAATDVNFDGHAMVAALSEQASKLGREAAEVRGAIEDAKEDWSKNAGEGVIRLFAVWLSLGLCWLVRWWLA